METKLTFDEHIEYLEEKIADNKKYINECNEEIAEYEKELEQVKQDKEDFLKNGTYEPSIYLKGVAEEKKRNHRFMNGVNGMNLHIIKNL